MCIGVSDLRVLHLDDRPSAVGLVRSALQQAGYVPARRCAGDGGQQLPHRHRGTETMLRARMIGSFLCIGVALSSAALAQTAAPASILVRIEGYVGAQSPAANLLAKWRVNRDRDVYDLQVTQLLVLTGDAKPADIINALRPLSPAFSLAGNPKVLQLFTDAPANRKMAITGYLRIEPPIRELVLSKVEPMNAPTPRAH